MIDSRLVLNFDQGQTTFRHIDGTANYEDLLLLAFNINSLQADTVKSVLLVTEREISARP